MKINPRCVSEIHQELSIHSLITPKSVLFQYSHVRLRLPDLAQVLSRVLVMTRHLCQLATALRYRAVPCPALINTMLTPCFVTLLILPPLDNMFVLVHELADTTVVVTPTFVPRSIYETIQEELVSAQSSPAQSIVPEKSTNTSQVLVADGDTTSVYSTPDDPVSLWDDERGIAALRRYHALQDEAQSTVMESKRVWLDTPFSIFAVQCKFHSIHAQ